MNQYLNYERIKAICVAAKANEGMSLNICSYRAKDNWNVMYNGRTKDFDLYLGDKLIMRVNRSGDSNEIIIVAQYIYFRIIGVKDLRTKCVKFLKF